MVEHSAVNRGVVGSSPTRGVFFYKGVICLCADVAQLAEQLICNQQVIGSSPIIGFVLDIRQKIMNIIVWVDSRVAKGGRL